MEKQNIGTQLYNALANGADALTDKISQSYKEFKGPQDTGLIYAKITGSEQDMLDNAKPILRNPDGSLRIGLPSNKILGRVLGYVLLGAVAFGGIGCGGSGGSGGNDDGTVHRDGNLAVTLEDQNNNSLSKSPALNSYIIAPDYDGTNNGGILVTPAQARLNFDGSVLPMNNGYNTALEVAFIPNFGNPAFVSQHPFIDPITEMVNATNRLSIPITNVTSGMLVITSGYFLNGVTQETGMISIPVSVQGMKTTSNSNIVDDTTLRLNQMRSSDNISLDAVNMIANQTNDLSQVYWGTALTAAQNLRTNMTQDFKDLITRLKDGQDWNLETANNLAYVNPTTGKTLLYVVSDGRPLSVEVGQGDLLSIIQEHNSQMATDLTTVALF